MLETTLKKIKAQHPCIDGWKKLLASLDKIETTDEPLSLLTILESNGLEDAIWALRTVEGLDGAIRRFACFCARYCLNLLKCGRSEDDEVCQAIEAEIVAWNTVRTDPAWVFAWYAIKGIAWDVARKSVVRAIARAAFTEEFKRLCVLGENYEHS